MSALSSRIRRTKGESKSRIVDGCLQWAFRGLLLLALQSSGIAGRADTGTGTGSLSSPAAQAYHTGGAAFTTVHLASSNLVAKFTPTNSGTYTLTIDFYVAESGSPNDIAVAGTGSDTWGGSTGNIPGGQAWSKSNPTNLDQTWDVYKNVMNHTASAHVDIIEGGTTYKNTVASVAFTVVS